MKLLKSKVLQKPGGKKNGKYLINLEVTDYDIEMIEDLAVTMAPFKLIKEPSIKNNFNGEYKAEFTDKYGKWIHKLWHLFGKMWQIYD